MRLRRLTLALVALSVPVLTLGQASAAVTAQTQQVAANAAPHATGIVLGVNESVSITASGTWAIQSGENATGFGGYGTFGPNGATSRNGFPTAKEACSLNPNVAMGALVSSVDGGLTWTFVGEGATVVSGPGELLLASNDCVPGTYQFFDDNVGELTVNFAPVVAPSAADCKNGGWKTSGAYKNQGDCVSFFSTGEKNPPANKG
jgi:hypothetical protein